MDAFIFYLSGVLSVIAAGLVVTRKNPVYSAIFLVFFFLTISLDFLILGAPFLAVIQVLVYAGAIMVLFLFVLMLLDLSPEELVENVTRRRRVLSFLGSLGLFGLLAGGIATSPTVARLRSPGGLLAPPAVTPERGAEATEAVARAGEVDAVARSLFTEHVFPFELTSILIMVAIVGAIYLSKRRRRAVAAPSEVRPEAAAPGEPAAGEREPLAAGKEVEA